MKKIVFTFIILVSIAGAAFAGPAIVTLITEAEGAMKDAPAGLFEVGRVLSTGPEIKIVSPEMADEYRPPVDIHIVFEPSDDAKVDMSKFKVEYIKIMSLDITDRFLQYTTKDGIRIRNADFPRGKHKLKVTIGDDHGGITEEIFTVKLL